jgi:anti-anti-sigma factor
LQEDHLQIDLQQTHERVTVVSPKGRLDMSSAPAFRSQVRQLVESGSTHLVVDLHDVSFVDSSGLGAVIGGLKVARQAGGDLRIARPNQQVQLVLDLTSLNQVLRPYGSLEEALAGF